MPEVTLLVNSAIESASTMVLNAASTVFKSAGPDSACVIDTKVETAKA